MPRVIRRGGTIAAQTIAAQTSAVSPGPVPVAAPTDPAVTAAVHEAFAETMEPTRPWPPTRPITAIASQANACLGLVGITGSGKTSLGVTAVEEAWEVYQRRTQWYASDLGGWGNKLTSLIRLGICRVWYIRNHVNPFTTMELASQGYWPEVMLDLETGLAAPDVRLIPPRQVRWQVVCPNNHPVATYDDQAQATAMQKACPTCGVITSVANALRMDRVVVRSAGFKSIGHYVYDSMTQMSEYGLTMLREKSAKGELPAGGTGGAALGSADALSEVQHGGMVFGTGSKAQYGFMQDRVPTWISNIRGIPDQVLPPTLMFGVEKSKGDDESGGVAIYGPKIAGNARTAFVPGWLGNCLYVAKEPHNPPEVDEYGNVVTHHRLWLVNHVSPKDDTPIVAKHRGEPLGMPDFLEDSGKPEEAWQRCSLRVFYGLIQRQAVLIEERDRARYANAPALTDSLDEPEEVLEVTAAADGTGASAPPSATRVIRRSRRPSARVEEAIAAAVATDATATGGGSTPVPAVEQAAAPTRADVPPAIQSAGEPPSSDAPSPIMQQLTASLEASRATLEADQMKPATMAATDAEVDQALAAYEATHTPIEDRSQLPRVEDPRLIPMEGTSGGNGEAHVPVSSAAPPRAAGSVNRIRRVPRPPAE
jgi:hypothetical protein